MATTSACPHLTLRSGASRVALPGARHRRCPSLVRDAARHSKLADGRPLNAALLRDAGFAVGTQGSFGVDRTAVHLLIDCAAVAAAAGL